MRGRDAGGGVPGVAADTGARRPPGAGARDSSSLGRILHVARNDLRLLSRDRGALFWGFLGPAIFVTAFGFLFKPSPDKPTTVYVRNAEGSAALSRALTVLLRDQGLDVHAEAAPGKAFEIVVPAGATDTLVAGRVPHLVLRVPDENPTPREQMLKAQVLRAVLSAFLGLAPEDLRADLDEAALRARVTIDPSLRFVKREMLAVQTSSGFQRTVPGYLVMFLLMTLLTFATAILVEERRSGQLRRVLVSSTAPGQLVMAKFLSRFAWAWLQIAFMLAVGLLYRVRFGAHPGALLAVLTAFALCATGVGLLFATFFRSPDKAAGLGSLVTMALAALGGCWWPLEIVPPWMHRIAFVLPTGWAFDGLNRVMAMDAGVPQVATHVAVLVGMAAVTLPLAARRIPRAG